MSLIKGFKNEDDTMIFNRMPTRYEEDILSDVERLCTSDKSNYMKKFAENVRNQGYMSQKQRSVLLSMRHQLLTWYDVGGYSEQCYEESTLSYY